MLIEKAQILILWSNSWLEGCVGWEEGEHDDDTFKTETP